MRKLFVKTTLTLALVALGPAVLIAILAPLLFGTVFGDQWKEAGTFVAVLTPMFYIAFVATSTGDILYVLERQGLHLVREILRLSGLGGSVLVAALLNLPPVTTIAVLSIAGCVTYIVYGLISWRAIRSHVPRQHADGAEELEIPTDVAEVGW